MKIKTIEPARRFSVGSYVSIELSHVADIELEHNQLVTFRAPGGVEHDVCRTPFGFYATQSMNGRLPGHSLRPALVKNEMGRFYVLLVEVGKEQAFDEYLAADHGELVAWLDGSEEVEIRRKNVPEGRVHVLGAADE
jgi:hypothetical protein